MKKNSGRGGNRLGSTRLVDYSNPERALLSGIILRAYHDLSSYDDRIVADAIIWFQSRFHGKPSLGFTFIDCCEYLNLDPRTIYKLIDSQGLFSKKWKRLKGIYTKKKKLP